MEPVAKMTPKISIDEWRARGRVIDLRGMDVFTVDEGAGEVLLVLHGFPTSSWDFWRVWTRLTEKRRALTLDYPGFGLSAKPPDYGYSLMEQADIVELFVKHAGVERVSLWAHDMGTSVATELLARREVGLLGFRIDRVILMNGSVHAEMAHLTRSQKLLMRPRLGPLFARAANRATYRMQLRRILARPVPVEELDHQFDLIRLNDGHLRLPAIMEYYRERTRFRRRWIGALERLDIPALILWGTRDPVAVLAIAKQLARETPTAKLERLEGVGHYPQLEAPDEVTAALERFLGDTTVVAAT
jgi:pimeloyl-ACP methyl ester carboxylesterase